jgi:alanyl-tRNA synthetase
MADESDEALQRAEQTETEQIREQIAETRERLGETVEALAYKADVKTRARQSAATAAESARARLAGVIERVRPVLGSARDGGAPTAEAGGRRAALVRTARDRVPTAVRERIPKGKGPIAGVLLAVVLLARRRRRRR